MSLARISESNTLDPSDHLPDHTPQDSPEFPSTGTFAFDRGSKREETLTESLASLQVNGDDQIRTSETSASAIGGTVNAGLGAAWLPLVPETNSPFLTPYFAYSSTREPVHTSIFLKPSFLTRLLLQATPISITLKLSTRQHPPHLGGS